MANTFRTAFAGSFASGAVMAPLVAQDPSEDDCKAAEAASGRKRVTRRRPVREPAETARRGASDV